MGTRVAFIALMLAAGCCFTGTTEGETGTTASSSTGTVGTTLTGTSTGTTTGTTTSTASSSSGCASSGTVSDAGCAVCALGGGGFGSGVGFCLTACPAGSCVPADAARPICVYAGVSCGYPAACGSSYACLDSDPNNCGACGHVCAAGQTYQSFACGVVCPRTSAFTELETDPENCGACGNACPAGQACGGGVCGDRCLPNPDPCRGAPRNPGDAGCTTCPGCYDDRGDSACVDLTSDVWNCGACGNTCLAGQICLDSTCGNACSVDQVCAGICQAACPAGLTACPQGVGMVCVDLQGDSNNCGACGQPCTACVGGSCQATCAYYGPDAG